MLTAYIHATVLDGTKDMKEIPDATVLVENGKICSVEKNGFVPNKCKKIDLNGKYMMPGLINAHCHLPGNGKPQTIGDSTAKIIRNQLKSPIGRAIMKQISAKSAKTELLSGTTTIRTVGGLSDFDAQIRDEIIKGQRIGARIIASNTAISVPGGHMAGTLAYISHSKQEAVELVDKIAKGKPNLIKLMITGGTLDIKNIGDEKIVLMSPEQIYAACKEAHLLGFLVAAHVQGTAGIRVAVENGVDTIEHGGDLDDDLLMLLKKKGTALVSTITVIAAMACLPTQLSGLSTLYHESCRTFFKEVIAGYKKAVDAGITIGMGMDNGSPLITQYSTWRELDFFTRYIGTSPEFAIYTATLGNAKILGMEDRIGSIEPGKYADFLIVNSDPRKNFEVLATPYRVVKEGKIYKPRFRRYKKYDDLLDKVKEYDKEFIYQR
jgi:imidazolonepropionase-like amidohydrolase